jgi:hypothetical protein
MNSDEREPDMERVACEYEAAAARLGPDEVKAAGDIVMAVGEAPLHDLADAIARAMLEQCAPLSCPEWLHDLIDTQCRLMERERRAGKSHSLYENIGGACLQAFHYGLAVGAAALAAERRKGHGE